MTSAAGTLSQRYESDNRRRSTKGVAMRAFNAVPPPGLILIAVISIQLGAALATGLFPIFGPAGTVFCRIGLAAIMLALIVRPAINAAIFRNAPLLLVYGCALGAMNWCFYEAIARIPLGLAVAVEFVGPLGVAVATSKRRIDLLWVAIAALGLALLVPRVGSEIDLVGVLFAGVAGVGWAAFILLTQRVCRTLPGSDGLAIGMGVATVLLLPFAIDKVGPVLSDPWLFLTVVGVATLSTAFPFLLEFEALRRIPARTYGVLVSLEPAIAALVGAMLLNEILDLHIITAVTCVTVAAVGATVARSK